MENSGVLLLVAAIAGGLFLLWIQTIFNFYIILLF